MAKLSEKKLEGIAIRLLSDTGDKPTGLLEDGVSVCKYVSDEYGIGLTIEQGHMIREIMDRPRLQVMNLGKRIEGTISLYPIPPAPSIDNLPADCDADLSNDERAASVENALTLFANQFGLLGPRNVEDAETIVGDFLADLGHFLDRRGLQLSALLSAAAAHYNNETRTEDDEVTGAQFEGLE
jgi:hypothetical protein